ncbi:Cytoplasmic dynein 2 heavy chain 1 [Homalodisca vitripennis]|nr:Cytoplasmic dynein 2 heavy chain 1 [Homalodisca vitripennis]
MSKTITRFIQQKTKSENIWEGDFIEVEAKLLTCLGSCNKWIQTCERLTTLFWPNYSLHRWSGLPYRPVHISRFYMRLEEILNIRTVDRQLTKLLSPTEQAQLDTSANFNPFSGVNAVQYNPYTEPMWQAAVRQFELHIQPAEERVAAKLKHQLRNANLNTLQLMAEFKRYQEVMQRPAIQKALVAERETLLSQLQDYVASVQVEPDDSHLRLVDMPPVVSRLYWVRQLEAKVRVAWCHIDSRIGFGVYDPDWQFLRKIYHTAFQVAGMANETCVRWRTQRGPKGEELITLSDSQCFKSLLKTAPLTQR